MKSITIKSLLITIILLFSVTTQAENKKANAPEAKPLDGKVFTGTMGTKGDKKGDEDNFEFLNGKFHSTACDQYGFTAAPYTAQAKKKSGALAFESTTQNKDGDKINWKGHIKDDKIEGTAVRKTASGKKFDMWFEGEVKKS
jgi:hypothetical protein